MCRCVLKMDHHCPW